jgi:hypothetical protein
MALVTVLGLNADFSSHHAGSRAAVDSVLQFPRVEGSNLEGRRFLLPAGFEAELNVVIVAFRREQQADVDSWLPFLTEQKLRERGVRVYELPTLSRSYRMVRRFIDGGMARGIPAKATREATITLYIDKSPFKKALAISTEDRIITMVVARDGRVLWRADGRFTNAGGAELVRALDALNVPAAP